MAIILEDFEDDSLAFVITGTWTREQDDAGAWSLRSAVISDGQTTDAVVAIPDQATSVAFRYRVSSEQDFDEFIVLIDGATVLTASGEVDWTEASFDVTGKSQVVFRYAKDGSVFGGEDAAWIDDLAFTVPSVELASTDSGILAETVVGVIQAPEVALASSDSATLVEARWVAEPQSTLVPPSIRSTSTGANGTPAYTVNAPPGIASGDTIIAIQAADRGSPVDMATPTGGSEWLPLDTLGDTVNSVARAVAVWWKRAGDAEPGLYTFKQFSASDGVCLIIAIRDASLTIDPRIERSTAGTGAAVTTPGITPASISSMELRLVAVRPTSTVMTMTPPSDLTPLTGIQSRQYTLAAAAARLLASIEETSHASWTASSSQITWRAGYTLAIAPVVLGPPQEPQAAADAATLGETASVIIVPAGEPVAADDTATLVETAAATADVVTSDMAALVETPVVSTGTATTDQAALTEAVGLQLVLDGDDQALMADTDRVDAQAAAYDVGVLAELVDVARTIGPVTSDTATLTVAASLAGETATADAATLTETTALEIGREQADQAFLTDNAALDAHAGGTDSGVLAEAVSVGKTIGPLANDGARLAETAVVGAQMEAADAGALAEEGTAAVAKNGTDTGQFAEVVSIGLDASDAVVLAELAATGAAIASVDSASLRDSARLEIPKQTADAAALIEHAEVLDIGREIVGVGLIRRGWSAHSPRRRWAAGRPRRAWRADSPHT